MAVLCGATFSYSTKIAVDNQRPARGLMVYKSEDEFGKLAEHLKRSGIDYWYHPQRNQVPPGRAVRTGSEREAGVRNGKA